jgi:phosphate:Na+ symporter
MEDLTSLFRDLDVLKLLGGVALLIYGIKTMGDALQDLAGDNMRRWLASLTGTPVRGVMAGAFVTMVVQSSSATTVMLVSFVHVGLMNLVQAFSVIMGANIGTTITAQFMAFSIQKYSIIAAIVGMALATFGRSPKQKLAGTGLVGFALLFVGMDMMQDSMSFLKGHKEFFTRYSNPWFGLAIGTAVTMCVQASSATVGLTMVMASQGLISLNTAIAIILGDNIGTTITAVLASVGGNRAAKQTATAHVMFNVIGAMIMMIALPIFASIVAWTSSDIERQVANSHSLFNIMNTLIFLPFIKPYTKLIKMIMPDDKDKVAMAEQGAKYLDRHLIEVSPAAGVDAVRKEMVRLGDIALRMLKGCHGIILEREWKLIPDVLEAEKVINRMTNEIVTYATEVGQKVHNPGLSRLLNSCVSGVSDIERIGDHGENLAEMAQIMSDRKLKFSHKASAECREMFDTVIGAVEKSLRALDSEKPELSEEALALEKKTDEMERTLRARHIERLNSGKCRPEVGVIFIDILSNLERVADHAHNIALIVKDIHMVHSSKQEMK